MLFGRAPLTRVGLSRYRTAILETTTRSPCVRSASAPYSHRIRTLRASIPNAKVEKFILFFIFLVLSGKEKTGSHVCLITPLSMTILSLCRMFNKNYIDCFWSLMSFKLIFKDYFEYSLCNVATDYDFFQIFRKNFYSTF